MTPISRQKNREAAASPSNPNNTNDSPVSKEFYTMNTNINELKQELLDRCATWRKTRAEFRLAAAAQGIPVEEVWKWYEAEETAALEIMEAAMAFAAAEGEQS
jgi:hypothetical protein